MQNLSTILGNILIYQIYYQIKIIFYIGKNINKKGLNLQDNAFMNRSALIRLQGIFLQIKNHSEK